MLTEIQRVHLQKLLDHYNFSHLRPPPEIYEIQIPESTYFVQIDEKKRKRRIFYRVLYLPEEEAKIKEIKSSMHASGVYENYSQEVILKHLYAADFDTEKCMDRLRKLQEFHNNDVVTTLSPQTIKRLQSGGIYTYGHSRAMEPIVIVQADKFDFSLTVEQNYNSVFFLMLVVLGFRTVPFYAEKYVCIFDLKDMNLTQIPYKYLYEVFSCMNLYYCGNVSKTYIFNAKGIGSLWQIAKKFIPEYARRKIIFIDEENRKQILETIDFYELEKKYGGKLENLTEYWPPKCTNEEFDTVHMLKFQDNSQIQTEDEFYSICNESQFFKDKQDGVCGSASCNCSIF